MYGCAVLLPGVRDLIDEVFRWQITFDRLKRSCTCLKWRQYAIVIVLKRSQVKRNNGKIAQNICRIIPFRNSKWRRQQQETLPRNMLAANSAAPGMGKKNFFTFIFLQLPSWHLSSCTCICIKKISILKLHICYHQSKSIHDKICWILVETLQLPGSFWRRMCLHLTLWLTFVGYACEKNLTL